MQKKNVLGSGILITLLIVAIFSVFMSSASAATTMLTLSPATIPTQSLAIGSTFQVTLHVEEVSRLWAWSVALSWDPAVLELGGATTEGPFLKSSGTTLFFDSVTEETPPGVIPELACTRVSSTGISGSGDLATITFNVVGYGSTSISLSSTSLLDPDPAATTTGHVEIQHTATGAYFSLPNPSSPTPTPTVSPSPTPTPSGSPHGPTATFIPTNGSTFSIGETVNFDASQSKPGYDTTGASETCPIANYAWRIEFLNGTLVTSFSGQTASLIINASEILRVILIVTAPDPTLPSATGFTSTSTTTAVITVEDPSQLSNIDVFTSKGGIGANVAGGVFAPQELVKVSAQVKYRGVGLANKDVAFAIKNPKGEAIGIRVIRTNATGFANVEFRPPWSDTNPESIFGIWLVTASVDVPQRVINDTVSFNFNYIITTKGIQLPASVQRSNNLPINVTINSINDTPLWSTLAITIYDEANVPIGFVTVENTNQIKGNITLSKTISIPTWAFPGQATAYIDILTNLPDKGGIPYCQETTVKFNIQP